MHDCQTVNPDMDHFTKALEDRAFQQCVPLNGTFELTARCNFDCNMCYVHLNEQQIREIGRELTNEEWLEIARQAKEAGMLYLTLTGGEVFARPHFRELYEALSKMGFLITILSNGYLVDENVIVWLKENPPYMLRFTLYGASDETYEAVCGIKNGFSRVSHAIELVQEAEIPFYMVGTLVKENQDDFEKMCDIACEKNISFRATTAVVNPVRGAVRDVDVHRIKQTDSYAKDIKKRHEKQPVNYTIKHILQHCTSFRTGFWITWNGNLQLCSFMHAPQISIIRRDFREAWTEMIEKLMQIRLPEKCTDCKYSRYCSRCPGILSAECGNYDQITEEFCSRAKLAYKIIEEGGNT